ncbi:aurora kinase A- and ninein-interacting protein [Discoglossus pictus]
MKPKSKKARVLEPEECGVWLDTSDLRRKPQQALLPRSFSSSFNPFTKRKAVDSMMIDFTQTRAPQLYTKQTSMYSFFTSVGKRDKAPIQGMTSDTLISKDLNCEESKNSEHIVESRLTKKVYPTPPLNLVTFGKNHYIPDRRWERNVNYDVHENEADQECPDAFNEERYKEKENMKKQNRLASLQTDTFSEDSLSGVREDLAFTLLSPDVCLDFSNKYPSCLVSDTYLDNEGDSTEQNFYNSIAASPLFTQDSQGNKVICHRSVQKKNWHTSFSLQDRTNAIGHSLKTCHLEEEASLKSMFTQDSEGNIVIKNC